MKTLNMDLVGLWNRINRYIVEVQKSQSANVSLTLESDLIRYKSYFSALRFLIAHVDSDPRLDLPETNPIEYVVREAPVLQDLENENCVHVALLLATVRQELLLSQSSRLSTGLIAFDKDRFMAGVAKAESYLENYVEKATPLDMPESSPRAPIQGAGLNSSVNRV